MCTLICSQASSQAAAREREVADLEHQLAHTEQSAAAIQLAKISEHEMLQAAVESSQEQLAAQEQTVRALELQLERTSLDRAADAAVQQKLLQGIESKLQQGDHDLAMHQMKVAR